jgi:hypothetical protein
MSIATIADYVTANNITVEVTRDRGMQVNGDGWEHHSYVLTLHYGPRTLQTDWSQGTGIDSSPSDNVASVFDSLVSDAQALDESDSFESFADTFGYDHARSVSGKRCRISGPG